MISKRFIVWPQRHPLHSGASTRGAAVGQPIYYQDPDGNEVEISCDNFSTKEAANAFMKSDAMAEAMAPPLFGGAFDPEELLHLHHSNSPIEKLTTIGL